MIVSVCVCVLVYREDGRTICVNPQPPSLTVANLLMFDLILLKPQNFNEKIRKVNQPFKLKHTDRKLHINIQTHTRRV